MQTLTPELEAILKSKFQAGADGFRGRLLMINETSDAIACDAGAISDVETWDIGSAQSSIGAFGGPLVYTPVLADPGGPSVVMTFLVARRTDDAMTVSDSVAIAGYTEMWTTRDGDPAAYGGFGVVGMTTFGEDGGDAPEASVTWTGNDVGASGGRWRSIAIRIPTTATAPLHSGSQMGTGGTATLDGAPTPGNLLIAFREVEGSSSPPAFGWVAIVDTSIPVGFSDTGIQCWARCVEEGEDAVIDIASEGFTHWSYVTEWPLTAFGTAETILPPPKSISIDKSLRLASDSAEVEFANEDFALGWAPRGTAAIAGDPTTLRTNQRVAIEQWYGDEANAIRTFTGLIDRISDHRDILTTTITCRDMMVLLIDQTFSATAPQSTSEVGAVRTAANGVYLSMEVSDIVSDILNRAGWRLEDREIIPTSYVLDEFIVDDGASWADTIIGDEKLTGLVGYSAWSDEVGVFHFAPTLVSQNLTDPEEPVYTFRSGEDIVSFDDETDQYDLRTRIKVRGPLTTQTLEDTWRELWRTSKITRPVGIWYDPATPTYIRVISRSTKRMYKLRQSDRTVISSVYLGGVIAHPLGLSGDPANANIYWVLDAPWIYTGSDSGNSVKKVRKSDNHVLASYSIPDGRWSALKVSSSYLYLTNLDTDRFYRRSKTDGSAVANYQHTYKSTVQANPSGLMIDGTTLYLFWSNGGTTARFLKCDESAPGTVTGVVKTAGTSLHGGEMDTTTHVDCYGDSDSANLVGKFTLLAAVDQTTEVFAEVVDTDLEDELGDLAIVEDRLHDTHPLDAEHQWMARRMTLDLSVITNLAQATQTAQRQLDIASQRRRVLDAGIIGNPALQKTDYVAVIDPITAMSTGFAIDTYRTSMDAAGTYLGTVALLPVEAVTDEPEDEGDAVIDTPALIASGTASGTNSATATLSDGEVAQAGDLLVAVCASRDNAANTPTGYTSVGASSGIQVTSSNARGRMWTKTAVGGETSVTVTTPGSDFPFVIFALFRPFANLAGTLLTATAGPSATPGQTVTPTGTAPHVVVAFFAGGTDGAGNSGPIAAANGYTEIAQSGNTGGTAFCPYSILMYQEFPGAHIDPAITSPNQRYGVISVAFET